MTRKSASGYVGLALVIITITLVLARSAYAAWVAQTVDSAGDVGAFTSLAEVGGQAAIGYSDGSNDDLKYARYLGGATTGNCGPGGNSWQCDTLDGAGVVGLYTSLAVVGGQPAISYY